MAISNQGVNELKKVFSETLRLAAETITNDFSYGGEKWNSVAHMTLVAAIERQFNILMDAEDVIGMSSFAKAIEVLEKYGVNI